MILRMIMDFFLLFGAFFALAGTIGLLRMPDAYCRMHASTNIATFGVLGVIVAALIYTIGIEPSVSMTVKVAVIGALFIITDPLECHAICKAAYIFGIRPKNMVCDEYGRDREDE